MAVGTLQTLVVCSTAANPCPAQYQQTVTGYVLDPGVSPLLETLLNQGGIDWEIVQTVFESGLFLFAIGAGIGLSINVVRRFR